MRCPRKSFRTCICQHFTMGGAYAGRRLYAGGKYSDLTVTCGFRQWHVHRAILCSRSGFFDGACGNAFLEAERRVIDLSEDDEEAVDQMIRCTCECQAEPGNEC